MKIVTIVGARPQFIKAGAISKAFKKYRPDVEEIIVHTGQHFDYNMSEVFFKQLKIQKPTFHLGIGGGSHGQNTGRMIEQIEQHLIKIRPDWTLVYGDTDSTLAATLSSAKLDIPTAHIEAGLRSYNMKMPEEINRVLTDKLSQLLFCPSENAIKNLALENIINNKEHTIINSGDVMFDSVLQCKQFMTKPILLPEVPTKFALLTMHRAANTDDQESLQNIVSAVNEVSRDIDVIFPIHPRTQLALKKSNLNLNTKQVHIIPPQSYFELLWLLNKCSLVLTDSGGLQKEAYFFGKPCITLREETEWVELLNAGNHYLAGADYGKITAYAKDTIVGLNKSCSMARNLYGEGNASEIIVKSF